MEYIAVYRSSNDVLGYSMESAGMHMAMQPCGILALSAAQVYHFT